MPAAQRIRDFALPGTPPGCPPLIHASPPYRGPDYAKFTAQGIGTLGGQPRMGHLSCVQRVSRAADDTPIHLRMERTYDVQPGVNGLERFLTTTRRQNFLVPPRRHRAFPLTEFT